MNRFWVKLLIFLSILITLYVPLNAEYFLLPDEIVQSYFPIAEQYTIPEDQRVSQVLVRAKYYEESGNYRQASRYYGFAYNKAQDSNVAPYIRFKQCYLLESLSESIKALKEIPLRFPDFPYNDAVYWELARRYYLNGDYEECITTLEEILDHESGGAEVFTPYVYGFLGVTYKAINRNDDAVDAYLAAIEKLAQYGDERRRPFIVRNYLEISRSYLEKKDYDRASDLLKRIIGSWEDPIIKQEAYILLAETFVQSGKSEYAYRIYSLLLEQYPDSLYRAGAMDRLEELKADGENLGEAVGFAVEDPRIPKGKYKFGEEIEVVKDAGFFIQIGSFSIENNASNLISVLKTKGFSAVVVEAVHEQKRTFRVWVGPLETLAKAKESLKELEDLGYKGFIVREK
ncbi:MAG: SPOR domain-containing protein [Spirochaetota bacterium]|nr:MAG: SPOR domain-containing protein [Spirochaetota bacterium]